MNLEAAENRWNRIRRAYPLLAQDLDSLKCNDEERNLLKIIYAGLDAHDLPSVEPKRILEYVRASIRMCREIPYAKSVPEELFYSYVLPPRVNNEYLDGSRSWLYEQLKSRVMEKSMLDAALEVNYWCCERAAYQSTDDRTIAPFGMCRRAGGRCGEESTLLTCALRAVGIPARQVYVPLWSHCDDNHAWVEFWADGGWHYMGACEPEPVPDRGWFDSAASRAMLVRSRVPDFETECGYKVVNSTARYADTVMLHVTVLKDGAGKSGVPVQLQLINESRLAPIHSEITDEHGMVSFDTGLGCLIVSAYFDNRLVEHLVDLRKNRSLQLSWENGHDPLTDEWSEQWELVPPKEKMPEYHEEDAAHQLRLRRCHDIRSEYEKTFVKNQSVWLTLARGNYREIEKFLALADYSMEDKQMLLSTLSEKDFGDVTCDILEDFLAAALPWKQKHPLEVWKNEILAPRVEHEMLLPVRRRIQNQLRNEGLRTVQDVYKLMRHRISPMPEYGLTDRKGNAAEYLRHGVCPESEWDILAVQICRAMGIPAKLHRTTENPVNLMLHSEEQLRWRENFSIAKWDDGSYHPIKESSDGIFRLEKGNYSLITTRRQIDGTVSANVLRFPLMEDRELTVDFQPDRTADILRSMPLPEGFARRGGPGLLLFLELGAEPTEHLLLELLELREEFNRGSWPIDVMTREDFDRKNTTFNKLLSGLSCCIMGTFLPAEHYAVQAAMGVGDARLPLAVVTDGRGGGVYACANYNIRSGHRLLKILQMIDS